MRGLDQQLISCPTCSGPRFAPHWGECFVLEQETALDVLHDMLNTAFAPGDATIFLIAAVFVGLAAGRFSALLPAVLMAVAVDVAIPGAMQMMDGASYEFARTEAIHRVAAEGGSGLLMRAVGYFGVITMILMIKRILGNRAV